MLKNLIKYFLVNKLVTMLLLAVLVDWSIIASVGILRKPSCTGWTK